MANTHGAANGIAMSGMSVHRRHRHVHVLTGDEQIQPGDRRHAGKRQQRRNALALAAAAPVPGARASPTPPRQMARNARCCPCPPCRGRARSRAHAVARRAPEPDAGRPDAPCCRYRTARRCGCAMARPRSRTTAHRESTTERFSPSILNSIGLNSTPRKSLTRLLRIMPGGPPASPPTIADNAARCAASARSSTTPANTQLPSAMILPERITSAKHSPARSVPPRCPLSMRKISAAVQWSWVTSPCGLV